MSKNKYTMNKKGFTLVELLATLVIIAIVMGIVLPSASRVSNDNKEKTYEEYEKMMIEYAKISPLKNNASGIIKLSELEELGKVKRDCTGYVERISSNPYKFKAYIKCPICGNSKYITNGFDDIIVLGENECEDDE